MEESIEKSKRLAVAQVAQLLEVSKRTVTRMAGSDLPAPVRLGTKLVRWRAVDIERFIAGGRS